MSEYCAQWQLLSDGRITKQSIFRSIDRQALSTYSPGLFTFISHQIPSPSIPATRAMFLLFCLGFCPVFRCLFSHLQGARHTEFLACLVYQAGGRKFRDARTWEFFRSLSRIFFFQKSSQERIYEVAACSQCTPSALYCWLVFNVLQDKSLLEISFITALACMSFSPCLIIIGISKFS